MSRATVSLSIEQSPGGGSFPPFRQSRCFGGFASAQFFHANFVRFAPFHPPKHVIDSGGILGAAAELADADKVAPLKGDNQFAGAFAIAIGFDSHSPNRFG